MKKIIVCLGSSCFARGNENNVAVAEQFLEEHGLQNDVDVDLGGGLCAGNCAEGPIVLVDGVIYRHVDSAQMRRLLEQEFGTSGNGKE